MMQGELALMVLRNALYTRLMSGHTRLKSMVDLRYRSSNVHWGAESKKITAVNDILIKYSSLYKFSTREIIRHSSSGIKKIEERHEDFPLYMLVLRNYISVQMLSCQKNSEEISFPRTTEILGTSFLLLKFSGGINMQGGLKISMSCGELRDENEVELPPGPSFLKSSQRTKQAAFRRELAYSQLPSTAC